MQGMVAKMPNYYSSDVIQSMLDKVRKNKEQVQNYKAPVFQQFVPQELDTNPTNDPLYEQLQNSVLSNSQTATATKLVEAQNKQDYQALMEARRRQQLAQQNFVKQGPQRTINTWQNPGQIVNYQVPKGATTVAEVGKLDPFGNTPLVHVNWRGHGLTLDKQVAPVFISFLNALWKTGYRPKVIGSYANRNIAGTNTPSLHSLGYAIDIDPTKNPVTHGGHMIEVLPPGIAALAAKYGLSWGGSWHSYKDPMHFSVAYGGRE